MDLVIDKFPKLIKKKLKNHIKKILLFGSHARGDNNEWSDYDFVVIVDKRNKKIENIVDEISGELFFESNKLIGSIVWDEKEWEFKKKFPIGINIIKDGKEL